MSSSASRSCRGVLSRRALIIKPVLVLLSRRDHHAFTLDNLTVPDLIYRTIMSRVFTMYLPCKSCCFLVYKSLVLGWRSTDASAGRQSGPVLRGLGATLPSWVDPPCASGRPVPSGGRLSSGLFPLPAPPVDRRPPGGRLSSCLFPLLTTPVDRRPVTGRPNWMTEDPYF